MSDAQHNLAQAVVAWLKDPASASSVGQDKLKDLTSAAESISKAFNLGSSPSHTGPGLQTVYEVFLKTQQKMGSAAAPQPQGSAASDSSASASTSTSTAAPKNVPQPSAEDLKTAEEHKTAGNKSMSAKDYGAAIAAYSQAIELNKSPIYYSNRAAAYSQIGQQDKAIEDAREAARIDPKFGKAYSRLGHALFSSGKYEEAVEAYQQGLLVDPENKLMQNGLDSAKAQAAKSNASASSSSQENSAATRDAGAGAGAGAGGFGGFPGMGGGAGGGMPDLASLMNNPMMAQMAQNMMANGGLEQLMQNPMLRSMAERMGSGGGGMPDMSQIQQLMQDPNIAQMARQFMGGSGGGGAGGNNGNNSQGGAPGNMFG